MESDFERRLKSGLEILSETLKPKIKKRLKSKHVEGMLVQKTNEAEFRKQIERLDNSLQIVQDVVDHKLPSLKYEIERELKNKADIVKFQAALDTKVDKDVIEKIIERINRMEEVTARLGGGGAGEMMGDEEAADEGDEELDENGDPSSPDSPKRKGPGSPVRGGGGMIGGVGKQVIEDIKKSIEDQEKKFQEMITNLSTTIDNNHRDNSKQINDNQFEIKRLEQEIAVIKKKAEMAALAAEAGGGGGGKISAAQQKFNEKVRERLEDIDQEVEKLQRIDFRLNKELVQKPYLYIDKVRDALDKE